MKHPGIALRNWWEKNWPEAHAAVTAGLPQFITASKPRALGSSVPAFCFHVVDPETFEADLDFLVRNGYSTINAGAMLDHLEGRQPAPEGAVVLSFDDGSCNLYDVVFPLLKRYGMSAVAFIAPGLHEEAAMEHADNHLAHPLRWSQIREMHHAQVIDFQSHTYEHRYVPRWPEPIVMEGSDNEVIGPLRGPDRTIAEDFRMAKETLETKLDKTVSHLAFPKYFGTAESLRIGADCGYKAFWWGVLPHRPDNRPGQSPEHIIRIDGRYLRRLPGTGRESLPKIMYARYGGKVSRLWPGARVAV